MANSVIPGTPAATEALAIQAVSGMITQQGQGKTVKILSIDVRKDGDVFIAYATVQIEEPVIEQKNEEKPEERKDEKILGNSADQKDNAVDIYYLHTHTSEAESALPDPNQDVIPQTDLTPGQGIQNDVSAEPEGDNKDKDGEDLLAPTPIEPSATDLSEKIQTDFAVADAPAYNVDPHEITAERLADKPLEDMNERELRELRAEVEQKLKEVPRQVIAPAEDGVNPNPSA